MARSIIQKLHDSEINGEVFWLYDSVLRVRLVCPIRGAVHTEAVLGRGRAVAEARR